MSQDIPGVIVVDNFFKDFDRVKQHAALSEFYDIEAQDGQTYKRVAALRVPGMYERMVETLGLTKLAFMGYRLNFDGESPNQHIHSDLGWGTHAIVVYLNDGDSGTAFWKHKATGTTEINVGDFDLFNAIKDDFDTPENWEQIGFVPMKANRAIIYRGNIFHSRFPFKAFGKSAKDGRLIALAFFSFEED